MAVRKSKTFEDNLAHIDDIIAQMESEQLPFDKSVELYKEGLKLINECNKQLEGVKQQVYKLEEDFTLTEFSSKDNQVSGEDDDR